MYELPEASSNVAWSSLILPSGCGICAAAVNLASTLAFLVVNALDS